MGVRHVPDPDHCEHLAGKTLILPATCCVDFVVLSPGQLGDRAISLQGSPALERLGWSWRQKSAIANPDLAARRVSNTEIRERSSVKSEL